MSLKDTGRVAVENLPPRIATRGNLVDIAGQKYGEFVQPNRVTLLINKKIPLEAGDVIG